MDVVEYSVNKVDVLDAAEVVEIGAAEDIVGVVVLPATGWQSVSDCESG